MTRPFTYYLITLIAVLNAPLVAQTQIEIINADAISFNKKVNEDRQVLYGNVKTKHENRFLICDSAYFYSKENKIEAFSNIHIWQGDTLSLEGDYLLYHGNHQLAEIQNNVVFKHNEMQLVSDQLKYNFEFEKGYFDEKALITQNDKSLQSEKGVYYATLEKFDFYTDVLVKSEKETLSSDTLYYWLTTERAEFKSNGLIQNKDFHVKAEQGWLKQQEGTAFLTDSVRITSLENNYTLSTDSCFFYNEMQSSLSYSNLLLSLPFNEDTLFLTADTLAHASIDSINTIRAYNKVSFISKELTGKCDSLSYNSAVEKIYLNTEPVLWLEDYQLSADSITLQLKDQTLQTAWLNKHAFITSKVDSFYFDQISGEYMQANFNLSELEHINVEGNGQSVYYIQDESSNATVGVNKIICSNMNIQIKNKSIHNIYFYQKPDATLYPIENIKYSDFILKGHRWLNQAEILNQIEPKIQQQLNY